MAPVEENIHRPAPVEHDHKEKLDESHLDSIRANEKNATEFVDDVIEKVSNEYDGEK